MPEVKTDLVINARTKGFQKSGQDAQKLGREGSKATRAVAKETMGLEAALKKLADEQVKVASAMVQAGDKGSGAYKKLADQLKRVQKESSGVEKTIRSLERAYGGMNEKARQAQDIQQKAQARGGFAQGFMQAAMPGAQFMQRGPGMWRQAAGVAAGGVARGMAMTPFTGVQGIVQALQSLPGGGMLAAPLMQSLAQAQGALQFKGQRQQLAPFLQMGMQAPGMVGETSTQQQERIGRQIDTAITEQGGRIGQRARAPVADVFAGPGRTMIGEVWKAFKGATGGGRPEWGALERARERDVEAAGGEKPYAAVERQKMIERAIEKEGGVSQQRRRTLQDVLRSQGQRLGFALPEAMQMMGGITQAGGGVGRELVTQKMGIAGMAAQRLYGVGADVSGAFLQGGRRGGVVGGLGRSGEAFTGALADAVRLGLEGAELTEYMGQMAGDIRQWRSTGISIDPASMTAAAAGFAGMGMGGVRGAAMARGVYGQARELSKRGPGGAEELMMLQTLGGFQGRGALDLEEAQLRLEEGDFGIEDIRRLAGRSLSAAGGGEKGRHVFRGTQMGKGMGIREVRLLQKQIQGGDLTITEQATVDKALEEAKTGIAAAVGGGPAGLLEAAGGVTDAALQRQSRQANKQLAIGDTMVKTMLNFEEIASNVNEGFTILAAGPLINMTNQIKDLTSAIPGAVNAFKLLWEAGGSPVVLESTAAAE